MSKLSKLILVVLFVLWLGAITPAQAQSTCGDLSASDCELLQTAQRITTELSSANFRAVADLTFGIEFFPDLIQVRLTADGAYQRQPTDKIDISPEYRPLFGLNADISAVLEATVSEFVAPTDNAFISSFDLRYVDGFGYAELTKFLPAIDPFTRGGGWYSVEMLEYLRRLVQDQILPSNILNLPQGVGGLDIWGNLVLNDSTVTRLDDIRADDQAYAVFELVFIFSDYLDNNAFQEDNLIDGFIDVLQAQFGSGYSTEELRQGAVVIVDLFRATEIRLVQTVGLTDGYVHQTQVDFDFAPNSDIPLESDPFGLSILADIELHISIDFRYTQFNNRIPEIIAPEESSPVRYDDLFGTGDSSPF